MASNRDTSKEHGMVNSLPYHVSFCKISLLSAILFMIGIVPLSKAVSNFIINISIYILKFINYDIWIFTINDNEFGGMTNFEFLSSVIESFISIVIILKFFMLYKIPTNNIISFGKFNWSFPFVIVICMATPSCLYVFFGKIFTLDLSMAPLTSWSDQWKLIIVMSIAVPLWEEIAWRGWVISYGKIFGCTDTSIIFLSSIFFSFMHLPSEIGVLRIFIVMPLAFGAGWLRIKSGGVLWPIVLHALVNFIPIQSILFFLYSGDNHAFQQGLLFFGI